MQTGEGPTILVDNLSQQPLVPQSAQLFTQGRRLSVSSFGDAIKEYAIFTNLGKRFGHLARWEDKGHDASALSYGPLAISAIQLHPGG
jgi:hypothetical protein